MADAMFGFCKSNSNIPISHLDYVYIRKCNDAKELECLLKILRSGEEGHFPDLIHFTEKRLESINPESKMLQKETKVHMISELQNDESKQLLGDLQEWSSKIKDVDKGLVENNSKVESNLDYPPIRQLNKEDNAPQQNGFQQNDTNQKKNTKKTAAPRSYNEWAKFDIESEVKKVDDVINEKQSDATRIHDKTNPLPTKVEISEGLSDEERAKKAAHEKEKGNEAFISCDFKEALIYYDRSISLHKSAAVFNNRAIANIKMEKFEDAIVDCDTVLKLEPKNVKAFLRRGVALKHLKRYEGALQDFSIVLELAPSNKRARELHEEVKKLVKETGNGQKNDTSNDHADPGGGIQGNDIKKEQGDETQENQAKKKGKRLKIIEVENTDDVLKEKTKDVETNDIQVADVVSCDSDNKTHVSHDADEILSMKREDEKDIPSKVSPDPVQSESHGPAELDSRVHEMGNSQEIKHEFIGSSACKEGSESPEAVISAMAKDIATDGCQMEQISPVPDDVVEIKNQGNAFYKAGRYAEAESKYSEAIGKLKEEGRGHEQSIAVLLSNRASCKLKIGDCKGCVKDCTESLEMRPTAKAFLRRAASYEHLENFRNAYADYQSALNFDNTLQAAWSATSRLGMLLMKRDGPKWREHLPKSESSSNLLQYEAKNSTYSRNEQSMSKRMNVEEGKNVNTADVKNEERREQEESRNGSQGQKTGSDVKTTERTIEQDKERFRRTKELGNKHVQKKEYEDAIRCYSECIKLFPDDVTCYANRSLCYLKLNQFDNVEIDASMALAIQDDNVKALFRRALARKGLGKYEEAVKDLMNLLEIDKSNSAARKEVVNIREMMKKSPKSKINIEEHVTTKSSLGNVRNDIGEDKNNIEPSKNEEMKQEQLNGDQRERGNGGRIDQIKEEKKKGKKLKIIEVESYDEIENVGRKHNKESYEAASNGRKEGMKDNNVDIDRKINMEDEKNDSKDNLNGRQKEWHGKMTYEEGLPDEIKKITDEGDVYFKTGRYDDANDMYTKALNAIGKDDKEHVGASAILYSKRAACKSKLGDLKSSIDDATKSLKLKPTVDSYLIRANAHNDLERYGNAYVDYLAALRLDSSVKLAFDACSRLMKVLMERDGEKWREKLPKDDESVDQIKRVDAVNVLKEERNDGERGKDEEQNSNAKQKFKRMESMQERFDRIKELGNKCVQEGKYQDATSYYSQCIEFDANEPISYVNRAFCYLKLNKPKKAENDCTKALDLHSNNIKALFRRALARKAIGKYKDSLQDLTTLLKLDPKNTAAQKELDAIKELWREELKNIARKQSEKSMESSSATRENSKKKESQQAENQPNLTASESAPLRTSAREQSQRETSEQSTLKENVQQPARKLSLNKASGFEFLKAWNELKGKDLQEYAHLLSQIEPSQLPKVISNKIDVEMILIIVSCVNEYFLTKDKLLTGFNILKYASRSERFNMGLMFLSTTDLSKVRRVVEELVSKLTNSKVNVPSKDVLELRKAYKTA